MPNTAADVLQVVAGILRDGEGRCLLAQRPAHKHQGGRWEFAGGKVEPGEGLHQALVRELDEELGIRVTRSRPFMTIQHRYPELTVRLSFREVLAWQGQPRGREGQPVQWYLPEQLSSLSLPPANQPIVRALQCSSCFRILPPTPPSTLDGVQAGDLVYLRGHHDLARLRDWVNQCRQSGAVALVADDENLARACGAEGIHLTSRGLAAVRTRPALPWLTGAAHGPEDLARLVALGADACLLSPVQSTPSHPETPPLGWTRFQQWAEGLPIPVYALGGVGPADLDLARQHGARGVAGIRSFWP